jgi:hypothetical protein
MARVGNKSPPEERSTSQKMLPLFGKAILLKRALAAATKRTMRITSQPKIRINLFCFIIGGV